jgi:hypothetical protein
MTKEEWAGVRSDFMIVGQEMRLQLHLARMEALPHLRRLDRRLAALARHAAAHARHRAAEIAYEIVSLGGA